MKRLADRRTVLLAAAATAAMDAWAKAGPAPDLEVTIGFEGGGFVPKGRLAVHLDVGRQDHARHPAATTNAESDGGSRKISVSLSLPRGMNTSSPQQVVARLQRADGWLLARGSTQLDGGSPVFITLYTVMR